MSNGIDSGWIMTYFQSNDTPVSLKGRQLIPNVETKEVTSDETFTLLSNNVLADCHVQRGDYSYADLKYIQPDMRCQKVVGELQFLDADVVCLQEVSPDFFSSLLKKTMESLGYEGLYIKRTDDFYDEGCTTFYKTSKFKCLRSERCKLGDLAEKNLSHCTKTEAEETEARERYVKTPDVAILTVLENMATGSVVTVANTHIAFTDMLKPDVQTVQIACTRQRLLELSPTGAHILCGDFNVFPDTPPYVMATEGKLSDSIVSQICTEANLQEATVSIFRKLLTSLQDTGSPMTSAYKDVTGDEPEATCVDDVWRCTPDFIMHRNATDNISGKHSSGRLVPLQVLQVHPLADILLAVPPSSVYPSDHIPLYVKFQLTR